MARYGAARDTSDTGQMTRGPAPVWRYIVIIVDGVVRSTSNAHSKEGGDTFVEAMRRFFKSASRGERVEFRAYATLRSFRAACAAFRRRDAR
jgi:hypothetical protein